MSSTASKGRGALGIRREREESTDTNRKEKKGKERNEESIEEAVNMHEWPAPCAIRPSYRLTTA
jgi:hypothetical protein